MDQTKDEQEHKPAPIEPGHVMSKKKYDELLEQQKQK
jgi:hypothetical protein